MNFTLKNLIEKQPKIILLVGCSMLLLNVISIVLPFSFFHSPLTKPEVTSYSYYLPIIEHCVEPIIISLVLFVVLKFKINSAIIYSTIVSLICSCILFCFSYFHAEEAVLYDFVKNFVAIFILVISWFIYMQTQSNKALAFALGYFSFLATFDIMKFVQNIYSNGFDFMSFGILFSVLISGFVAGIFQKMLSINFSVFKVNTSTE